MKPQKMMKKTSPANTASESRSTVSNQTAIWLSVVMLVVGFIGGTIFGVIKSGSLPGMPSATSNEPPTRMFQALEDEVVRNPQNASAWVQLGNAYFDADQHQKAIAAYEKSLAIEPDNPDVWTDLGVMYRQDKQPEKAVAMFSKAMALDPKHEVSRMNKGIVLLYDLHDEAGAVEAWEALLEINPLATFGDGQTVDERVRHYKEGHDTQGEGGK